MSERFFSLGSVESLGEDEVVGVAITGGVGRDGDVWVPSGIDLTNYRANPVVLRQHDPDMVVGSAVAIGLVDSNTIGVRVRFAPPGASAMADETRALAKAGMLRGISAGIDPIRTEPLDPSKPYGAWRVLEAELLEISLVSVPADAGALITQRSLSARRTDAMLRSMPAVSDHAIRRALRFAAELARPLVPPALRTPAEQFEADRHRCMAAWSLNVARQGESAPDYARRQEERAALAAAAPAGECMPPRIRVRPYGL